MSKLHKKTGSICMICDEKNEINILLHKTRRQTHVLCVDCIVGYLKPIIDKKINKIRTSLVVSSTFKCPGTINGYTRNMCKHDIDFKNIVIPECDLSLDLFRLLYILKNNNVYVCPDINCGNLVEVDTHYIDNSIICYECKLKWCRMCFVSPYHEGKSCIEVEMENNNSENGKMICKLNEEGKLKFCPCCRTPCIKNDGCNKMVCTLCEKKWCWLCLSIDVDYDHYNTTRIGSCSGKLWEGVDTDILPDFMEEYPI